MKIFLDANILISVLNKEFPLFTYSSRILSLTDHPKFTVFTSPVCLAIAFYFAEKKHKTREAKARIELMCSHLKISTIDEKITRQALSNPAVNDFEDGLEYYTALQSKCQCIITEDLGDFYFSEIEVLTSESFFKKYMA